MSALLQFKTALSSNIQALTNSSVRVSIMGITAGASAASVTVMTKVAFLDGQRGSAQTYVSVLTSSNTAAVFGSAFSTVSVDVASIGTSYVSLAGELLLTKCCANLLSQHNAAHAGVHVHWLRGVKPAHTAQ